MAVEQSNNIEEKLKYIYGISQRLIHNNEYKNTILQTLLNLYAKHINTKYIDITNCQFLLNNSDALANTLINILKKEDDPIIAYQICLDLYDNGNSAFLKEISRILSVIGAELEVDTEKLTKLNHILEGTVHRMITQISLSKLNKTDSNIIASLKVYLYIKINF